MRDAIEYLAAMSSGYSLKLTGKRQGLPDESKIARSLLWGQTYWGFQRGLNIPFGRDRGSYPDRELPG